MTTVTHYRVVCFPPNGRTMKYPYTTYEAAETKATSDEIRDYAPIIESCTVTTSGWTIVRNFADEVEN
jgi:hypothetical protein